MAIWDKIQKAIKIFNLTGRHFRANQVTDFTHFQIYGQRRKIVGASSLAMLLEIVSDDSYGLRTLDSTEINSVVDVGANVGVFSIAAVSRFPNAKVFAFEPSTCNFNNLKTNIEGLPICIFNSAVGGADGQSSLKIDGDPTSFYLSDENTDCIDGKYEVVEVKSLKSILELVGGQIDLLKLDCEGAEYEILNTEWVCNVRHIRAEVHFYNEYKPQNLISSLRDRGFTILKWDEFEDGKGIIWAKNQIAIKI